MKRQRSLHAVIYVQLTLYSRQNMFAMFVTLIPDELCS